MEEFLFCHKEHGSFAVHTVGKCYRVKSRNMVGCKNEASLFGNVIGSVKLNVSEFYVLYEKFCYRIKNLIGNRLLAKRFVKIELILFLTVKVQFILVCDNLFSHGFVSPL